MKLKPLICMLVVFAASQASAQDWTDMTRDDGEGLFAEKCGMCHRANGMGTVILGRRLDADNALLENREDLQKPFVETVVRSGFNIMFPMSRGEVSDEQLQKIAAYLTEKAK